MLADPEAVAAAAKPRFREKATMRTFGASAESRSRSSGREALSTTTTDRSTSACDWTEPIAENSDAPPSRLTMTQSTSGRERARLNG